jgi:hypothetical protein
MTMPSSFRPRQKPAQQLFEEPKQMIEPEKTQQQFPSSFRQKKPESFPKELARSFIEGAVPSLSTPGALQQRKKEAEATPEELINLVESDVLPSYTDLPTHEEIENFLESTFGIKGKSEKSKYAQRIGNTLGTLFQTGGFTPSAIASMGIGAGTGEFVEQKTESPILGLLAELGGTGLAGLLKGAFKKVSPNKLIEAGEKLGLSKKITTPLATSKTEKSIFGKFASKGRKTENLLKETKETLGTAFEDLNKTAANLPSLSPQQNQKIASKFEDVTKKITKTLANTPDEKSALDFINDALEKLKSKGSSPDELVNFYRTINSKVNWKNMSRGDIYKNEIKNVIKDTLKETNPEFSKDFELLNDFYSRFFDLEKSLSQNEMQKALSTFNDLRRLGQIGWGFVSLNPVPLIEAIGEKAFQLYARESLINPMIRRMNQGIINAAKSGSEKTVRTLINSQIQFLEKEYPKEFKDLSVNIHKNNSKNSK